MSFVSPAAEGLIAKSTIDTGVRLQLGLISGVLIGLAHGHGWVFAWFAFVPWLFALQQATPRVGFYVGLLGGATSSLVVAGFAHAGWLLFLGVGLSYAGFAALFGILWTLCTPGRPRFFQALIAAGLWVGCEWLHAQVPYAAPSLIGNTQHGSPWLGLARVGGVWSLSFMIAWAGAAMGLALASAQTLIGRLRALIRGLAAPGLVLVGLGVWAKISEPQPKGTLDVAVVQGGLPTWLYQKADQEAAWRPVPENIYQTLSRGVTGAALTVWPETAVWNIWGEDGGYQERLQALQAELEGALLVGLPRRQGPGLYTNSAVFLNGAEPEFVDKRRLALRAEATFTPGQRANLLSWPRAKDVSGLDRDRFPRLGVLFCLETVVPQYGRELAAQGALATVVLAEGSRFGHTRVGWIHAHYSIVRAVETGRALLHAGQHGYSMLIDARGHHTPPLAPYRAAGQRFALPLYNVAESTPYVRWGPWMVGVAGLIVLTAVAGRGRDLWLRRKRRTVINKRA